MDLRSLEGVSQFDTERFWGSSFARCPYGQGFSREVPTFQLCEANFSKQKIDMEINLHQKLRQGCGLVFLPSKFPSGSMTPSGYSRKYIFLFSQKLFVCLFNSCTEIP